MTDDGLTLDHVRVRKTGGLQYPLSIDATVARLLAGCDGTRTVRQLVEDLGPALGVGTDKAVALGLPVVRMLLERAVLLPAT